jgi:hypothetical protein
MTQNKQESMRHKVLPQDAHQKTKETKMNLIKLAIKTDLLYPW